MKLIVSLLVLCLTLSIMSVQVQTGTGTVGNMEDMNAIVAGNIAETITCNITGNAAIAGMDNTSGKMENMTGARIENMTGNQTGSMTEEWGTSIPYFPSLRLFSLVFSISFRACSTLA